MQLLMFAHKKEAWAFLQERPYVLRPHFRGELYQDGRDFILITGEGLTAALFALTQACTLLQNELTVLANFGVAAAIDSRYKLEEIYSIRTVYAEGAFHSFSSADQDSKVDLISARQRVRSAAAAQKLLPFAPLVDRELWALGFVAAQFQLPFYSYKIISDFADATLSCQTVKEEAQKYSQKLFHHWQKVLLPGPVRPILPPSIPEGLHMTFTMEKRYQDLLPRLAQYHNRPIENILHMAQLEEISARPWTPKKKAQTLLQNLEGLYG